MRKLKIIVSFSKGALPALALAALVPAAATCSGPDERQTAGAAAATGEGGAGGAGGEGGAGGIVFTSSSTTGSGAGGDMLCEGGKWEQTFTVEVPPEGVPA